MRLAKKPGRIIDFSAHAWMAPRDARDEAQTRRILSGRGPTVSPICNPHTHDPHPPPSAPQAEKMFPLLQNPLFSCVFVHDVAFVS